MMNRQVDWGKVFLLIVVIAGIGYAAKSKLGIRLATVRTSQVGVAVKIPEPRDNHRAAVQPLVVAGKTNPAAAAVIRDFLASYAFVLEHDEFNESYDSSQLMRNIETGLELLVVLQREVGDIDIGPALNKSLQTIWGDETKTITKAVAAEGIYACAWGLQL